MAPNIPDAQHVADALWMKELDWEKVPAELQKTLTSEKNSAASHGQRVRDHISWLMQHQQTFNPKYDKRYAALQQAIGELTPQQAYIVRTDCLGNNASEGYDPIPAKADLKFPRDHEVKLRSQVGWHFFVGSVWAEDGQEYGVELMFFGVALQPPAMAAKAGLTDQENQITEMQLGISKAGDRHHQADPVIVSGTSGLFECSNQPFTYKLGKNQITSISKDSFFPLKLQARGVDRGAEEPFEIGLDLEVTSDRGILYQGEDGAMPSLAGFGTLYYSIPNLTLKAGSTITYGGKEIKLKKGLMWFDHQWGFMAGNPDSTVLRAASNMSSEAPASGWDWFMHQFNGDRQVTVFSTHSNAFKKYYFQDGPTPPPNMVVSIAGKYMDENNGLHDIWGTMTIDQWIKAETSPNPDIYPVTSVWHPNHWVFEFDEAVPEDIRTYSLEQIVPVAQTNYFANTAQYNEGAVILRDTNGKDIGRGFAEAVSYANTMPNAYRLAGFDGNKKLIKLLEKKTDTLPRRLKSLLYVLTHQAALKKILQVSAGMKLMGPKPKTPASRH